MDKLPKYLAVIRCYGLGHNNGFYLTDKEPKKAVIEILEESKKLDLEIDLNEGESINEENLKDIVEKSTKETKRTKNKKGELFYTTFLCQEDDFYTEEELSKLLCTDARMMWALTYEVDVFNISAGSDKMREDIEKDLGKFDKEKFISKYEIDNDFQRENIVTKLGL